jgi:hypothetical protein
MLWQGLSFRRRLLVLCQIFLTILNNHLMAPSSIHTFSFKAVSKIKEFLSIRSCLQIIAPLRHHCPLIAIIHVRAYCHLLNKIFRQAGQHRAINCLWIAPSIFLKYIVYVLWEVYTSPVPTESLSFAGVCCRRRYLSILLLYVAFEWDRLLHFVQLSPSLYCSLHVAY